jgi:uncharacterized protein YbaR (Trm112 family)
MSSTEASRPSHSKKSQDNCAHQRAVDYELSEEGEETGNLICKECGAIFPVRG